MENILATHDLDDIYKRLRDGQKLAEQKIATFEGNNHFGMLGSWPFTGKTAALAKPVLDGFNPLRFAVPRLEPILAAAKKKRDDAMIITGSVRKDIQDLLCGNSILVQTPGADDAQLSPEQLLSRLKATYASVDALLLELDRCIPEVTTTLQRAEQDFNSVQARWRTAGSPSMVEVDALLAIHVELKGMAPTDPCGTMSEYTDVFAPALFLARKALQTRSNALPTKSDARQDLLDSLQQFSATATGNESPAVQEAFDKAKKAATAGSADAEALVGEYILLLTMSPKQG